MLDLPNPGTDWLIDAKCKDTDEPDAFFPENRPPSYVTKLCIGCPVVEKCLDYAIRNKINHGIWGGLTPQERTELQE
jgi:WhiB family redox-sensing transcriptional regulator